MSRITAAALEEGLGQRLRSPPLSELASARYLLGGIRRLGPPWDAVGEGAVKQWIQRYRTPAGAERVETVEDLEGRFGESIRYLAAEPISAYKFCRALSARSPPLVITDALAKQWLRQYGGQRKLRQNVVAPTSMQYQLRHHCPCL